MSDHGGVLISRDGGKWSAPEATVYDNEGHLQAIIATAPQRVPGVSQDARAVVELPTSGGPIDVCIVGMDGSITVVECKLASNTERRRMVIGQVIDYAAAICQDGADAFFEAWRWRSGAHLNEELEPAALGQLRQNVADARIDLCLAVDHIDSEIRRLIEYLNRVTRADVMVTALQLAYARDGNVEILIPSTYGGELAAVKVRDSNRNTERWTWDTFLAELRHDDDKQLATELLSRLEHLGDLRGNRELVWFGSKPSGGLYFHPYGLPYAPFQLWVNSAKHLMVFGNWGQYGEVAHHAGFAPLAELLGQDHLGGSKSVRAAGLDLDNLWATALECATTVNE